MKRSIVIASFGVVAATSLALGVFRHPFAVGSAGKTAPAESCVQSNVTASTKAARTGAVKTSAAAIGGHTVKSQAGNDERAKYEKTISSLKAELEVQKDAQRKLKDASAGAGDQGSVSNAISLDGIAKMMKTPAMRDVIKSTQKGMLDSTYGQLFRCLPLTAGDLSLFKSLLTDKQEAIMDVSLESMDQSLPEAERKKNSKRIKAIGEDYENRIKTLLGEENFGVYRQYEETQPERTQVTMFKGALSGDAQLDQQQEHDLVRALYEEREKFTFSTDLGDPEKAEDLDMSAISDEMISQYMADMTKLEAQSETRVAAILTPVQLQQFKQNQEQQRKMLLSVMNMTRTMFSAKAK